MMPIAFHSIRIGICDSNEELIQKNIEILRLLEETDLLKIIEHEIASLHANEILDDKRIPWML